MTLVETVGSILGGTVWVHLAGTTSEVLTALATAGVPAIKAQITSDDGTNIKAVYCKQA